MKKLKKNKPLIYLLAILSIFVVGRTFAYYLEEVSLPNRFKTMTYNIIIGPPNIVNFMLSLSIDK